MDDIFKKMEKAGQNDVDHLVQWMKDSRLVEATKEGEAKAQALFKDVTDKNRVELPKFKQVLEELAKEQHKNVEQLSKMLVAESQNMLNALNAGLDAFVKGLKTK